MAGGAYAANYYIAPSGGSDGNLGTSTSAPWASFSHAMNVMSSGDTLNLMDGTYNTATSYGGAPCMFPVTVSGITIQGMNPGQKAVIDGGGKGGGFACGGGNDGIMIGNNISNVVIKNLTIQNASIGVFATQNSTYITVKDCIIHDVADGFAMQDTCANMVADSNIVYNFSTTCNGSHDHAFYFEGNDNTAINNLTYNNVGYGWSIQVLGTGYFVVANNTLCGNWYSGTGEKTAIVTYEFSGTPYVFNNISYSASDGMWNGSWNSGYEDYNLIQGAIGVENGSAGNTHDLVNVSAGFVNSGSNNYQIASGSAAIGAGTSSFESYAAPTYDIAGTSRPQGSAYDIGAYEYVSSTQYAITASAGSGGGISPSGSVQVSQGGNQSFTITPNTGYHIANVTVDGASLGAVAAYTFSSVSANHTIAATFTAKTTYTITATAGTGGSISPSGSTIMNQGVSQSYTITPNSGYKIASVTVDGASVGAVATYTFSNVSANHTIAATFSANTYTITASAGTNGVITPSGTTTVNGGGSQTYTITPVTGYLIASVTVDGTSVGTVSSYTFSNVTANHTIAATFVIDPYTIAATAGTGGSISPSGSVSVNYGASQSFTITPAANYKIASVTVDGASVGAVATYTFSNVTANHSIAATFSASTTSTTYTITATSGAGGSISPSGATTVNSGGSQTYTITPSSGYSISSVLVDGASAGAVSSYTFSNVTASHTISATFTTTVTTQTSVFATNAGGGQHTSQAGVVYKADTDYSGGTSASTSSAITGTSDSTLYQTERYGNFSYNIPLANGNYNVTLKFAEIYWNAAGQRIFNVSMQGTQVISNLDIYATVGKDAAYDVTIPVSVTNGTLNIKFTTIVDNAKVSAIVVTGSQSSTSTSFATNGGGGQYTSASSGIVYQADADFLGGTKASTTAAVTGTSDPTLYQTERYGNFSYNIPLANGNYNVTLKFAEIYWNGAGQRIFNVSTQGTQVISNLDIYSKVGKNSAYDVTIPVSVTNGVLNIKFTTVVDNAKVSAILVKPN